MRCNSVILVAAFEIQNLGQSESVEGGVDGYCVGAHFREVNDVVDLQKLELDVSTKDVS